MQIDLQTHDFLLTEGLRMHVEQRLRFALTRFQDRVARVAVHSRRRRHPAGGWSGKVVAQAAHGQESA